MESNLYEALGQVSSSDAGQLFRDHLRGCVRQMICEVMAAEADELCGVKHQPSESEHFRAGGSPGRVVVEGERESVVRPRVRKRNSDGGSEKAILTTYQAARDPRQLQDSIVTALMHGVSTRDVRWPGFQGQRRACAAHAAASNCAGGNRLNNSLGTTTGVPKYSSTCWSAFFGVVV